MNTATQSFETCHRRPTWAAGNWCMVLLLATAAHGAWLHPLQAAPNVLRPGDLVFTDSQATILRWDRQTGTCTTLASGGYLVRPCGIAVDADRQVYVADTGALGVIRIEPWTGRMTMLAQGAALGIPYGIAVGKTEQLWVANGQHVVGVDLETGDQRIVSSRQSLQTPLGVVETSKGDLFVADAAGRIVHLDPASGTESVIAEGEHLASPMAITCLGKHILYVSDPVARRIMKIDARTGRLSELSAQGHLAAPLGLAPLGAHSLVVADPDALDFAGALIQVDLEAGTQVPLLGGTGDLVNARGVAVVPGRHVRPTQGNGNNSSAKATQEP